MEKKTTTYTVVDSTREVLGRKLPLEEAAHEVMTYNDYVYEIKVNKKSGFLELWISRYSKHSPTYSGLIKSRFCTKLDPHTNDLENAKLWIYQLVIDHAYEWCGCQVYTDAEYEQIDMYELEED